MTAYKTIDAHAGGQPLRLIVEGYPAPRGRTMLEKQEWAKREADHIRQTLMLEPRGHGDMCGAVLTEPVLPGSHAGLLFMNGDGYSGMSGHAVMAVTAIVLERGLLMPGGDGATVVYDTPAGTIRAHRVAGVREVHNACRFVNVPSFVLCGGLPLKLGPRVLRADVAFAGAFYAIVDSEAAGLGVNVRQLPDLRRAGVEIARAVEATRRIVHPLEAGLHGIDGTIFTAPAGEGRADLRSVTVSAGGAADRSPGGTSTAAIMAVLNEMGLLGDAAPFVHESVIGTCFLGRITAHTSVGEHEAVVPEIEGAAWITGEHTFLVDDQDPLNAGFSV